MATTIAYSAASKGNILALTSRAGGRFAAATTTSAKFPLGRWGKSDASFPRRGLAVYCTGPVSPDEAAVVKELAGQLDIRVGRVVRAWRHEEAESLYVEEVDLGEAEPRVICSGLVGHVPLESLQGLGVVVLANLKPRNMRGVKSSGMLLAASSPSRSSIELLSPPPAALPGHRVWFHDRDQDHDHDRDRDGDQEIVVPDDLLAPASPNQIQKKKVWEAVQPHLKTDGDGVAVLAPGFVMTTPAGVVRSPSLTNANIS